MDAVQLDRELRSFFERDPQGAVAVYLFGSVARGTLTARSDIDLGILYEREPPATLEGLPVRLEATLASVLGRPVQIVVLNRAPADLVHRVLRDGRLLLDLRPSVRIRFEVRARNGYFDLVPILRRYRRSDSTATEGRLTDPELLAKRLALIETCVSELRTLARPADIARDVREERFVEHTLQIAIQAALDVASHVISDERLGEPRTNRELFELLSRRQMLPKPLADTLGDMVGFRNTLVHSYDTVDLAIVRDVVEHHLHDLLVFVQVMRKRLGS